MGIFSSLKKNFKHGGVKVQLQAQDSISLHDATLPVAIIITATDTIAHINVVKAEITATSFDKPMMQPLGQTQAVPTNSMGAPQTVAQAADPQPFTLNPGESKTVQLNITISSNPQQSGTIEKVGDALSTMLNPHKYVYKLYGSANVEGIALDPSASQSLHVKEQGGLAAGIQL